MYNYMLPGFNIVTFQYVLLHIIGPWNNYRNMRNVMNN